MTQFPITVSGNIGLAAAVADDGTVVVPYPTGTTRDSWAAIDAESVQVAIGEQDVYTYPDVEIALAASITITNRSGVIWRSGQKLMFSAKQPVLDHVAMSQAAYDALSTKDSHTIYNIPEA